MNKNWAVQITAFMGLAASFLVAFLALVLLRGWVLSVLWGWFLVPLGIPAIGISHALGVNLIVTYLIYQYPNFRSEPNLKESLTYIFIPFAALGIGWVFHFFM